MSLVPSENKRVSIQCESLFKHTLHTHTQKTNKHYKDGCDFTNSDHKISDHLSKTNLATKKIYKLTRFPQTCRRSKIYAKQMIFEDVSRSVTKGLFPDFSIIFRSHQ